MDLRARAERWLADDPDPDTRAELRSLLDAGDDPALAERFAEPLAFGTAGIRGPLGAGPARMNRAVVRRVTAAVARRLQADPGSAGRPGLVGRDARHKSDQFAQDAARVLAGAGLRVVAFDRPVATPLVAFAVRRLQAAAGVQITASHNPPGDNGYKLYWSDGMQIIPPLDAEIAAGVERVGAVADLPLAPAASPLIASAGGDLVESYLQQALRVALHPGERDLAVVYTPLHGVAAEPAVALLARAGFADVRVVPEQARPDPAFPTVAFPNPERPGALDLALALAERTRADLVLANDPDGDRIAMAIPDPEGWRVLSGDEIGCLLADYLLAEGPGGPERQVATTVVSSRLLRRIAEAHGVGYAETLTGFKWLARTATDAAAQGRRPVLAYEEALGVMVGDAVLDKDGLSAALVAADLAAHCKAAGRTVGDALDDLARRFGLHATAGRSLRLEDGGPAPAGDALARLHRAAPRRVAGIAVVEVADHCAGVRSRPDGTVEALATPPTDLLGLSLADGSRLQVRPSGTEPLLKFYVEVVEPVAHEPVSAVRRRARRRLRELGDAFVALVSG
ncbi:MAG TPA: phospho-sugar mutase [Egibacteraceae bacterium]|nr:phospho-sugar mutase [Egibacteraceae bacterium]